MLTGEIDYLFAFDVADEIATPTVRQILTRSSPPFLWRDERPLSRDLPVHRHVAFQPKDSAGQVFGQAGRWEIRVYEIGVVTVTVVLSCEAQQLSDLDRFHHPQLDSGEPLAAAARRLCQAVCDSIQQSLIRYTPPSSPEAYTVFVLRSLAGSEETQAWFADHRREVAGLLTKTPADQLSDSQAEESLRIQRSFRRRDLTVIDWEASLVIDLDHRPDDVLAVLELANLQLEEYRALDQRLDQHLERAYKDLEQKRAWLFSPARKTLSWVRRFRVDMARLNDEVTHITKFFGDWHLARVYAGAQERFHLGPWRNSVEQRLTQLDRIYSMLQTEISEARMLWLEVAIVVCFIVDLLALFSWKR